MKTTDIDEVRDWALSQFTLGPETIHGVIHWETVMRHGIRLAELTPGADLMVVCLFALLHDCRRVTDARDHLHGSRAAEAAAGIRGKLLFLDDRQFDLLAEACRYHTDGHITKDPTIGCCWDADRLDLVRVKVRPKIHFLSTEAAKGELEH